MTKPRFFCIAMFFLAGAAQAQGVAPAPLTLTLTFGIVPQQSAARLAALWTPILRHLSEKTGYAFQFKTARDIPTFEQRVAAGEYDLAYMNPYHYVVFNRQPGYRVFASEKDMSLAGVLVVARNGPITRTSELDGKTVAFPAPAAFAATLLLNAQLRKEGVRVVPRFVSSHDSVYQAVAKGLYPAGGGVERTLENLDPTLRKQLRVLWTTDAYPAHAIAAHPRVPGPVVEKIRQAMINMHEDPAGRDLLAAANFKGITVMHDNAYDRVRALKLDLLDKPTR
jgi:phosphonate transport system substrate-binding protein